MDGRWPMNGRGRDDRAPPSVRRGFLGPQFFAHSGAPVMTNTSHNTYLGTLSNNSGRSKAMTPALCMGSMFCGRVASSATVCTNATRSFWYFSNTWSTARVDAIALSTNQIQTRSTGAARTQCHGSGTRPNPPVPLGRFWKKVKTAPRPIDRRFRRFLRWSGLVCGEKGSSLSIKSRFTFQTPNACLNSALSKVRSTTTHHPSRAVLLHTQPRGVSPWLLPTRLVSLSPRSSRPRSWSPPRKPRRLCRSVSRRENCRELFPPPPSRASPPSPPRLPCSARWGTPPRRS